MTIKDAFIAVREEVNLSIDELRALGIVDRARYLEDSLLKLYDVLEPKIHTIEKKEGL